MYISMTAWHAFHFHFLCKTMCNKNVRKTENSQHESVWRGRKTRNIQLRSMKSETTGQLFASHATFLWLLANKRSFNCIWNSFRNSNKILLVKVIKNENVNSEENKCFFSVFIFYVILSNVVASHNFGWYEWLINICYSSRAQCSSRSELYFICQLKFFRFSAFFYLLAIGQAFDSKWNEICGRCNVLALGHSSVFECIRSLFFFYHFFPFIDTHFATEIQQSTLYGFPSFPNTLCTTNKCLRIRHI